MKRDPKQPDPTQKKHKRQFPGVDIAVRAWLGVEGQAGTVGSDTDVLGMYTGVPRSTDKGKREVLQQDADDL